MRSSKYRSNNIEERNCVVPSIRLQKSLSKIEEDTRSGVSKTKSMTLPRLPAEETASRDAFAKTPSKSNSCQQKYVSLPSASPADSKPPTSIPCSSRGSIEFREIQSNTSAVRRASLLDQIKNPGIHLRRVESSKTNDVKNRENSLTESSGSISCLLHGAMKNIRNFKGNSGIYNLEEETYRCWDSSDSN